MRKHFLAEWKEIGQGIRDIWAHDLDGKRGRFTFHYESKRFRERPGLLIARMDFLYWDSKRRNYNFNPDWVSYESESGEKRSMDTDRVYVIGPGEDWYTFRESVDWPLSYNDQYWTPWTRDKMTFYEYFEVLGNEWGIAYKNGARPSPDPYKIPVREEIHG